MRVFIGVTDNSWFHFLSSIPDIEEVNFWQPSGKVVFRALQPGEPFLFKLHSPHNYIVGGGFFAHSTILPLSMAWEAFGIKNGAPSLPKMKELVERHRRAEPSNINYQIGCILLEEPFFFHKDDWIPAPRDWKPNIVKGKTYDVTTGIDRELWDAIQMRIQSYQYHTKVSRNDDPQLRYGTPTLVAPRLGQGTFRVVVADVYNRRCAVTQERTLPALEAAHIKPYSDNGPHRIDNGILLRSDIHKLFDSGYVTITKDHRFEVSRKIKEEFENGRDYYSLQGKALYLPPDLRQRPDGSFITWHNENVYRG